MFNIGLPEIILILVVVLLVFGANRLPEIGRAIGRALNEFKKGMQDSSQSSDEDKQNPGDKTSS